MHPRQGEGNVLLFQGAEARLYKSVLLGQPCVVKERFQKRYRHPTLDAELTNSRLIGEARAMVRSRRGGVDCPVVYYLDTPRHQIYMEWIDGMTLKTFFDSFSPHMEKRRRATQEEENQESLAIDTPVSLSASKPRNPQHLEHRVATKQCQGTKDDQEERHPFLEGKREDLMPSIAKAVGESIAKLHSAGLIHGDLTTSNIILRNRAATQQQDHSDRTRSTGIADQQRESQDANRLCEDESCLKSFSVALIDFGLSSTSTMAEDRAVDLYVMERALKSSHPHAGLFMDTLLQSGYLPNVSKSEAVAKKLEEVRQRGRKRLMIG